MAVKTVRTLAIFMDANLPWDIPERNASLLASSHARWIPGRPPLNATSKCLVHQPLLDGSRQSRI